MQKTKFTIQGMHCNSCATLIEQKLKSHAGVLNVKVSYESGKGSVAYDENKVKESEIFHLVKQAGDYQVKKLESEERPSAEDGCKAAPSKTALTKNNSFAIGFLSGFSLISLIFNIYFMAGGSVPSSANAKAQKQNVAQNQQPANDNTVPAPSPSPAPANDQPRAEVQSFTVTKADHVRGNFNAPVTLVEFSDFECPFCERQYTTMNQVLANYPTQVRLVYKHFPLGFHPQARPAAIASECASEQGKFWEYHDKLFTNQSDFSAENFKKWAGDLSLDTNKFNTCLDSEKYSQKVQTDYQEGQNKAVQGTPATFVNGKLISGALPYESFKQAIDSLLN